MNTEVSKQAVGAPSAFSLPRAMWTAALAGGAFGTVLANTPVLGRKPYLWYAVGAWIAIYTLTHIFRKFGRGTDMGKNVQVAAMSGLLPGLIQWAQLPVIWARVAVPQMEASAREARSSPNVPTEQVTAMLHFYHSPAAPYIMGAIGLIGIVAFAAIIGFLIEVGRMMLTRDHTPTAQEA